MGNTFAIVSLGGPGATSSTKEYVEANARLIAAAPELLEALRAVLDPRNSHFYRAGGYNAGEARVNAAALNKVRAAIAKAEAGA